MHFTIVTTINQATNRYQYHARFVGANGQIIWWTENYTTREAALSAISLIKSGGPSAPVR